MKRVYATRDLTNEEMRELVSVLGRCGFPTATVGRNYIAFYEKVEIRRMANGPVLQRGGTMLRDAGTTD